MMNTQMAALTMLTVFSSASLSVQAQVGKAADLRKLSSHSTHEKKSGVTVVKHDSKPLTNREKQVVADANKSLHEMKQQAAEKKLQDKMNSLTDSSRK